jgi:predicted P-loop ATPase
LFSEDFFFQMDKIVNLPVSTTPPKDANDQRTRRLFAWADAVLRRLGLVTAARSIEELRRVTLDVESAEVIVAIRDALHPANGDRKECFVGLTAGGLKQILKNRFAEMKQEREAKLRRGRAPRWEDDLILDKKGNIRPVIANLILIITHGPDWKGALAYDEFSARVILKGPSPLKTAPEASWTDHHETQMRAWFQSQDIRPAAGDVGRAVQAAARLNSFHPVRDYFDALVWDGVPRLEGWLQKYFHVEDSKYVRAVGRRFLISGVARIYKPGCQVDHMLVLEGPQGKLKSTALRTLAVRDAWFTDRLSHVGNKDALIEVAGVLIVELSEMDAITRATASAKKSYLTSRSDRFRPPYGRHLITLPRQCVFAGTINPPAGGYLRDPTGARRFWPVKCVGRIDLASLEQARDQLWAEAVHLFKAGAPWWLETPELEALATAEQEARFATDAWEDPVRAWIGDRTDVGLVEVIENALGFKPERQTYSIQARVVAILTHMGFTKHRARTRKGRAFRYRRDPPLKN